MGENRKPLEVRAPTIYVYATGREPWVMANALAEDGTHLGGHCSSSIGWAKHDMGVQGSDWKHDAYNEHYPGGFRLEWIDEADLDGHEGFQRAFALNKAQADTEVHHG